MFSILFKLHLASYAARSFYVVNHFLKFNLHEITTKEKLPLKVCYCYLFSFFGGIVYILAHSIQTTRRMNMRNSLKFQIKLLIFVQAVRRLTHPTKLKLWNLNSLSSIRWLEFVALQLHGNLMWCRTVRFILARACEHEK